MLSSKVKDKLRGLAQRNVEATNLPAALDIYNLDPQPVLISELRWKLSWAILRLVFVSDNGNGPAGIFQTLENTYMINDQRVTFEDMDQVIADSCTSISPGQKGSTHHLAKRLPLHYIDEITAIFLQEFGGNPATAGFQMSYHPVFAHVLDQKKTQWRASMRLTMTKWVKSVTYAFDLWQQRGSQFQVPPAISRLGLFKRRKYKDGVFGVARYIESDGQEYFWLDVRKT